MPTPPTPERAVLFAGGGTGGHVLPAVAVAEQLITLDPSIRLAFATSTKPIDRAALDAALPADLKHPPLITPIPAHPPIMRPMRLAKFAASWGPSVRTAREMLRALPERTVVLALGGYVAPPVVQAARVHRRHVAVLNIDAVPGKANRWIKRRAVRAFTTYDISDPSWTKINPIVRDSAIEHDKRAARRRLGLDPDTRTLLITGGSQGARTINDFALAMLEHDAAAFDGWQVIHQTGDGRDDIPAAYERAHVPALCRPFFDTMRDAWGAATLTLARAGAGTVSEAWANRVPALFMPYPFHKDNHQHANARPLTEAGAAIVVTDRIDTERNMQDAGPILTELLTNTPLLDERSEAARRLPQPDGAAALAHALLKALNTPEHHD